MRICYNFSRSNKAARKRLYIAHELGNMLHSHVLVECFKMAQSFPARKQAIQIIFLQVSPSQLHKPSQKEHPCKSTNVRPFILAYSTDFCLQVTFLTCPPSMLGLQFALHCIKSFCYYYNKDVFDPYSWTFPHAMTLENRIHWCEIHQLCHPVPLSDPAWIFLHACRAPQCPSRHPATPHPKGWYESSAWNGTAPSPRLSWLPGTLQATRVCVSLIYLPSPLAGLC